MNLMKTNTAIDANTPWGEDPSKRDIDDTFEQLDAESRAAHAKIDERAAKAKDFQVQLGQLNKAVTDATQRLATATAFKEHLSKRILEIRQLVLNLWGQTSGYTNVDPAQQLVDFYQTTLTCEQAIKDFSRIEPVLRANLDAAQRKLTDFQRQK